MSNYFELRESLEKRQSGQFDVPSAMQAATEWVDRLARNGHLAEPGRLPVLCALLLGLVKSCKSVEPDKLAPLARQIRETAIEIDGLTAESDPMAELDAD